MKRVRGGLATVALVLFFLFLLLFGALILRYGLGMSLREKYLRGPAQGTALPHTRARA